MAEVTPLKLVPTTAGQAKFSRFSPGDAQGVAHGGTGASDADSALANLGGAKAVDLTAHLNASNPHGITAATLGAVLQTVFDAHANNTAIHRQINDSGETLLDLWSALQIKNHVQAQIDALVGSAPGALDTINELAAALGNDPNAITTLTNDIALKLPISDRGASEGVCELVAGLVPLARMPFQEPVFGQYYAFDASEGVSTTTDDDNFHTKLQITTEDLPDSWYELHVTYGWNHDSTSSDFVGQVLQNGVQIGQLHKEEPQDSSGSWNNTGTNQRRYISRCFLLRLVGVHTFKLGYQTDDDDDESSIWDGLMRFFRVKEV